jgi:hypothetical protein
MRVTAVLAMTPTLVGLVIGPGVAHADDVQRHVSPDAALRCQDTDRGQSRQASNYGDYPYQADCSPFVHRAECGD